MPILAGVPIAMTWKTRLVMRESAFTAATFTVAVYFYYYFAFWGLQDHFTEGPLRDYMASRAVHIDGHCLLTCITTLPPVAM